MKDLILRRNNGFFPERGGTANPFASIQREMDRFFDGFFDDFALTDSWFVGKDRTNFTPKLNVSEDDEAIAVSAELPGMNEKDIQVSLDKNVLTIKGEKKDEHVDKDKSYHHVERRYGSFQRSIRLSSEVDSKRIKAAFKDGVLSISMPKSEKEQARKIEVKSA